METFKLIVFFFSFFWLYGGKGARSILASPRNYRVWWVERRHQREGKEDLSPPSQTKGRAMDSVTLKSWLPSQQEPVGSPPENCLVQHPSCTASVLKLSFATALSISRIPSIMMQGASTPKLNIPISEYGIHRWRGVAKKVDT